MFNYLEIYRDNITAVLLPNEQALAMIALSYLPGEERIGKIEDFFDFDLISGLYSTRLNRGFERLVGGLTLVSPPDGIAVQLTRSLQSAGYVLLTTQRLIVLSDLDAQPVSAEVPWQCPRHSIAFLQRNPRLLFGLGRIRIGFTDSSYAVLVAGTITSSRAKQLVNAFNNSR